MSYYLTLIGTRDNPLYETEIVSKTNSSGSTASTSSFFSSVTSSVTSSSSSSNAAANSAGTGVGQPSTDASLIGAPSGSSVFGGLLARLPTSAGTGLSSTPSSVAQASNLPTSQGSKRRHKYELQMIAHSALDTIEDAQATSGYLYLKSIDRIQEFTTSCFVVPGNIKFILLHEHKHEEGIKNFFLEIWEAFLKVSLNPFQDPNAPITNATFDTKVRAAARKFL
ncbi:Sedlin [Testicularia cyperi]|uniref:Sedlin n=1 Tax=Testicularia cyperi TaxID=1882483 RepID=A0A317XW23_9BASI|nr:Sedlin [Testicularia cyperi]